VRCGGGTNHRMNLGEALLVKDNHLRLAGGIGPAVALLRKNAPPLRLGSKPRRSTTYERHSTAASRESCSTT